MAEPSLIGRMLGKYRVLTEIGRGGMGVVYGAHDTVLDRPVAIKVLAAHLAWEKTFVDRFVHEARTAAKLDHPHIVTIHDVGEQDGIYYLVMKQIEGEPLNAIIAREGPLPPKRTAGILVQVAEALDYAHSRGVIHRDVKSGNILVEPGDRPTLTDFGIARAAEGTRLTATGISLGTPEYMSPEQALGEPADARSDVYSLGVVLYEMLTGRVPFHADTPLATLLQQAQTPPPSLRSVVPGLSREMEDVVLRALAKQPDGRYATAGDLARSLGKAIHQAEDELLAQQLAEAVAWIGQGLYDKAIGRLEPLARAYPNNNEIATRLAEARTQARLAGLYAEVRQLWTRAQAKAEEILTTAPRYADPDGLLRRLSRERAGPAVEPEEEWPRWVTWAGLAAIAVGTLARLILYRDSINRGGDLAVSLLFVLLGAMATWRYLPIHARQGLILSDLALALWTASQTYDILPRPYTWFDYLGEGFGLGVLYILEFGILLGIAAIFWTLFVRRQYGWGNAFIVLGIFIVILSYSMEWTRGDYWARGYEIVYHNYFRRPYASYPWGVGNAAVLFPAMSILGGTLLRPSADDPDPRRRKKRALWSLLLAGSALAGMIAIGLYLLSSAYWGLWLVLAGLALIFLGVIGCTLPILRPTQAGRNP